MHTFRQQTNDMTGADIEPKTKQRTWQNKEKLKQHWELCCILRRGVCENLDYIYLFVKCLRPNGHTNEVNTVPTQSGVLGSKSTTCADTGFRGSPKI